MSAAFKGTLRFKNLINRDAAVIFLKSYAGDVIEAKYIIAKLGSDGDLANGVITKMGAINSSGIVTEDNPSAKAFTADSFAITLHVRFKTQAKRDEFYAAIKAYGSKLYSCSFNMHVCGHDDQTGFVPCVIEKEAIVNSLGVVAD